MYCSPKDDAMAFGLNIQARNASQAQNLILVCVTVIVVAAFVERYAGVNETASVPQIVIGAFVVTALLILLSFILPEFAVGLAVTAMVAMILTKGQPFWDAISNLTGNKSITASQIPSSPLASSEGPPSTGTYSSQPLPQQNGQ